MEPIHDRDIMTMFASLVCGFNYGFTYIAGVSLLSIVPALFIRETQKLSP